MMTQKIK